MPEREPVEKGVGLMLVLGRTEKSWQGRGWSVQLVIQRPVCEYQ